MADKLKIMIGNKEAKLIMLEKTKEDLTLSLSFHAKKLGIDLLEKVAFATPRTEEELKQEVFDMVLEQLERVGLVAKNIPRIKEAIETGKEDFDEDHFEDQFYINQEAIKKYTDKNLDKILNKFLKRSRKEFAKLDKNKNK